MDIAISLAPSKSLYRWVVAINYQKQDKKQAALDNARIAARLGVNDAKNLVPRFNKLTADLLTEEGGYQEAERTYERALAQLSAYAHDISPSHSSASQLEWAQFNKEIEHSLSVIRDKLAAERPSQKWIRRDIPWFLFGLEEDKAAIAASKALVVKMAPGLHSGKLGGCSNHSLLGSAYLTIGDVQDAVIESLAAIELDPTHAPDWQTLAQPM